MSIVTMRAIAKKPKEVVSMRPDMRPVRAENHRPANRQVTSTHASAAKALGNLKDHSLTPKSLYERSARPVEKRRLLEIADVIEMGDDIIALFDHLAGDLRIPAFIGLLE